MKKTTYSILLLIAVIAGCEKKDTIPNRTAIIPTTSSFIKVMHMSPNAPLFNLMVDSIRAVTVLETAANTESGIAFGNVIPSTSNGYSIVPGGPHTVSAKVPSTSTTLPGQTILSKSATLAQGKFYSIVVIDSLSRLDAIIVEDDLNVPDTSKAYFRIANFIVNGTADVEFVGSSGGYNFSKNSIPFKNISNFDTLKSATYKIFLRANGSATKLDSIAAFAPTKGRKYTLYARGVVGQTGSTNAKRPIISPMTNL